MSEDLDPYRQWLGIADPRRPPNHYQLLGLRTFEADQEKIWGASMSRMAIVLEHDPGPHAALSRRLFDEIEQARNCLADTKQKAAYDVILLREQILAEPGVPQKIETPHDDPREHVLNEADEHQMMVVAENLSDSQTAMLKSRLATLKPKSTSSVLASSSTLQFPKSSKARPAVSPGKQELNLLRTVVVSVIAAALVVLGWLAIGELTREPPPPDPLAPLIVKLSDPNEKVRLEAANELARTGPRMVEAVPHLLKALENDPSDGVRYSAAQALAEAGPSLVGLSPQLNLLADREKNPTIRRMIKNLASAGENP